MKACLTLIAFISLYSLSALSYPKYAVKNRTNRCTLCHIGAIGGGPRNLTGKALGAHGSAFSKYSQQDTIFLDVRQLYYEPESKSTNRGGMGIMAATIYGNVLVSADDAQPEMRYVGGQSFGFPGGAQRSSFLQFKRFSDAETSWSPQYIQIGRMHAPFGLQTDEHRTYTKMQTSTDWNNFETGVLVAANPRDWLHYDFALTNGEKNSPTITAGGASKWGGILNVRFLPTGRPFMAGFSVSSHDRPGAPNPSAYAVYSLMDFSQWFDLTMTMELAEATHWNPSINGFVANSTYKTSVAGSTSQGAWGELEYSINDTWSLRYKVDYLLLDKDYGGEFYIRNGVGVTYYGPSSLNVQVRVEDAEAKANAEAGFAPKMGGLDALFVLMQVSI